MELKSLVLENLLSFFLEEERRMLEQDAKCGFEFLYRIRFSRIRFRIRFHLCIAFLYRCEVPRYAVHYHNPLRTKGNSVHVNQC